jgi:beta-glucosidase
VHERSAPRRRSAVALAAALALTGLGALLPARAAPEAHARQAGAHPWSDASLGPGRRADLLLAAMTPDEKVSMLHGAAGSPVPAVGYIAPIPRLGVPGITMTDGPAGVRNGQKATEMPAPVAQSASFDPAVARSYGAVVGGDARALGQDQLFGPGMNIARVPTNGRTFEYLGEDPYLAGTIAGANVRGVQSKGVVATVKHFLANNQETDRTTVSANVDDRTLHEIYGKAFGLAVRQGRPGSVMCAYNRIGGVHSCSNAATLTTMLRRQMGFDGYVVSDYPATHATTDLAAGLDVELPSAVHVTPAKVSAALADGRLTQADVDQRVREVLTVLFRFGFFDRDTTATSPIDEASDNAVARSVEERGAVLLKNDDGVLPLPETTSGIAVIGTTAAKSAQGGGSSKVNPLSVDNALDAITAREGGSARVTYDDGGDPASAAAAAKSAQVALVFVHDTESEGGDRANLSLPSGQDALISAVAAANRHTVVVLETGGPVLMPWLDQVSGVLEAWYPGARGGAAIARLLWGDVAPSGRLPQTFPAHEGDIPASTPRQYPGVNGRATYSEGLDVGYRWYDTTGTEPLFPFGYGLSYTSFAYSDLTVARRSGTSADPVRVSFTVTNTGRRAGSEAAQVYIGKPHTPADGPPRELAAYKKVTLAPGQSRRVTLTVDPLQLAHWDSDARAFTVPDGPYSVAVGPSSRTLPLTAGYEVRRTDGPVRLTTDQERVTAGPGGSFTVSATVSDLSDYAYRDVTASLTAPAGWTVAPLTPTAPRDILPGGRAVVRWRVTVPEAQGGGTVPLEVGVRGTVHGANRRITASVSATVPFASLAAGPRSRSSARRATAPPSARWG